MKILRLILIFTFCIIAPGASWAAVILEDDFNDTLNVDTFLTTAYVDTANGCVQLPSQHTPNAIAMKEFGDYVVATTTGIKYFSVDDTGGVKEDPLYSVPTVTNATGIAVRQDAPVIWAITSNSLSRYEFNEAAGMSENPNLKVTGLSDVLSVASAPQKDSVITLSRSGAGTGIIDYFEVTEGDTLDKVPSLSFDTGISNPVSVSFVGNTPDMVIATQDALYYYAYDEAGDCYTPDPSLKVSTTTPGILAVSANNQGEVVLISGATEYYGFTESAPKYISAYSTSPLTAPVAISMNPNSYDYALVTENGEVQYYTYDEALDQMRRVPSMEQTGLVLAGAGYLSPRDYYSKTISLPQQYDEVKLTAEENLPVGTSISYFISSDGGSNWTAVSNGVWATIPLGNNFIVKATLNTTISNQTPKILRIIVETTTLSLVDLIIRGIAYNDPGQPTPVTSFPARVKAGAEIQFQVETLGYSERVWAQFSDARTVEMTPLNPVTSDSNTWRGLYTVDIDADEGSIIWVTLTAQRGTKQKHLTQNPFIQVQGKVSQAVDLLLTE